VTLAEYGRWPPTKVRHRVSLTCPVESCGVELHATTTGRALSQPRRVVGAHLARAHPGLGVRKRVELLDESLLSPALLEVIA
jgi:hypothetical protein